MQIHIKVNLVTKKREQITSLSAISICVWKADREKNIYIKHYLQTSDTNLLHCCPTTSRCYVSFRLLLAGLSVAQSHPVVQMDGQSMFQHQYIWQLPPPKVLAPASNPSVLLHK